MQIITDEKGFALIHLAVSGALLAQQLEETRGQLIAAQVRCAELESELAALTGAAKEGTDAGNPA